MEVKDGQHRYNGRVHNCFICYKDSTSCHGFSLPDKWPPSNESWCKNKVLMKLAKHYGGKTFVICPSCWAKGRKFIAAEISKFISDLYNVLRNQFLETGTLPDEYKDILE